MTKPMPTRLSPRREEEIVEAYNRWDPSDSSVDDLAAGLGVSRQTIYGVLRRHGVPTKTHRRDSRVVPVTDMTDVDGAGAAASTKVLIGRVEELVLENTVLRGLVRKLHYGEDLDSDQQRLLRELTRR